MTLRFGRRTLALLAAGLLGVVLAVTSQAVCLTAWVRYGLALDHCPDGRVRATYSLSADQLQRGGTGEVRIRARANYARPGAERFEVESFDGFTASVELVDGAGKVSPLALAEKSEWRSGSGGRVARLQIPVVPDGEYTLRARVSSRLGDEVVEAPIAFFAPARVQVITDRPLYEPGHQLLFRAVVLRAQDLTPLDGRPGRWVVTDPSGEVVLEERAAAGPWGVVAGSLPLDRGAPSGDWRVRWVSGDASDEAVVRVEPFTVPRFRVEASAQRGAYGPGERPVVKGAVIYASGAPVSGATVELVWSVAGPWPAPRAWDEGALPKRISAGRDGRFTLELPEVPYDLRGRNALSAQLTAVDAAGDRVNGSVALLLAEDRIQAEAVTELGEGLVEGFNNRLYVRAASAEGTPLSGAELTVKRAWDPKDPGVTAVADEDGVASLQLDPGVAVNVVIPAMPYRPPPPEPSISIQGLGELISGDEVSLADQVALERALASFERCAVFTLEDAGVMLAVRVSPSGTVTTVAAETSRLGRCLAEVARARTFAPGSDRLLTVSLHVSPADVPYVEPSVSGVPDVPGEVSEALGDALLSARACLPRDAQALHLSRAVEWRTRKGAAEVTFHFVQIQGATRSPEPVLRCLQERVPSRASLARAMEADAMGVAQLRLIPAEGAGEEARPQPTTFLGYEFVVTARAHGRELGTTRLRMRPGSVPSLRLRPSAVVASPGQPLEIDVLRGPDYQSELPETAYVTAGPSTRKLEVDRKARKIRYQVPGEAKGWLQFELGGARALVFVQTGSELALAVKADREAYAPGQLAHLQVETLRGGQPVAAAVGLFGVDETLGQLAPLPGAETFARVWPVVPMSAPAFGVLDAQALVQGRIRGANATAATVLRVSSLPAYAQADVPTSAQADTALDTNGELTDAFYNVLAELHVQARKWEAEAPKEAMASPQTIAALWSSALKAVDSRGERTTDAFGRPLRLSLLPPDLLALTDPRAVVVAGTRLPEDIENWSKWVAEEAP